MGGRIILFFELFPLFLALICVTVAVILFRLNRQASRRSEFFVAATSSYLLFEDPWAMQAAILAALTADRDTRLAAIAALDAIARSPGVLVEPLLSADSTGTSSLHGRSVSDAGAVAGRRAAHLATLIRRFDGNLRGLRQDLERQAPRYERALRYGMSLDTGPFTRLDPAAVGRLQTALADAAARAR